jgi:FKBP-type peptidyl-prolyl cis-trans isomerase
MGRRNLLPLLMAAMFCWIGALGTWHWSNLKAEAAAEEAQRQSLAHSADLRASQERVAALQSEVKDTHQRISKARQSLRAQTTRLTEAERSITAAKTQQLASEKKMRELAAASKAAAAEAAAATAALRQAKEPSIEDAFASASSSSAAAAQDPSGLKIESYQTTKPCPDGKKSRDGLVLSVHYDGTYTTGKKFDSSRDRGMPFKFALGSSSVIKGWDQGLGGMCVGDKRKLTVPKALAYGKDVMLFDVELLGLATPLEALQEKCAALEGGAKCGEDDDCEFAAGKCTGGSKWMKKWAKDNPWWWTAGAATAGAAADANSAPAGDRASSGASGGAPSHDIVYGGKPVKTLAPRLKERFDCQGFHFKMGAYTPPAAACFRKMREKKSSLPAYNPALKDVYAVARTLNCERYINVLLVSNSQNCFLDNYVTNVNKLDSFPVIVSIATDIGAFEACTKLSAAPSLSNVILLCAQSPKMSKTNVVIGKEDYGTEKFGAVAWQKVPTIRLALKMGMGIMLTDIDMIWSHNPSPYLLCEFSCCKARDTLLPGALDSHSRSRFASLTLSVRTTLFCFAA